MKEEIKKKFLDILFETEEEGEVVIDEPIKEVKLEEKVPATAEAQKFLYNKKQPNSFISVDKRERRENKKSEVSSRYEIKPNISPMFGVVGKNSEPIVPDAKISNVSNNIKKSKESYLGTIISPIYGYDVKNDFSNTMNLSIHKVDDSYEEKAEEPAKEEPVSYYDKNNDIMEKSNNDNLATKDIDGYIYYEKKEEPKSFEFDDNDFLLKSIEKELAEVESFDSPELKLPEVDDTENKKHSEPDYSSFSEPEVVDYAADPIFQEVLSEEKGSSDDDLDLFEDLFEKDED